MGFAIAGAIGGALITSNAMGNAAQTQADAAGAASAVSNAQYQQTRTDQAPWRAAGGDALNQINEQMGNYNHDFSMADFTADPGYQFRMQEGQKAIERSAAARGGLNSGATMKALDAYNSGEASQQYQQAYTNFNNDKTQRFNRLSSLAGLGQTATANTGAAGANNANNISQNIIGAGNAQAAATIGQGNAINNGIGQGINTWMQQQYLNRSQNPYSSGTQVGSSGPALNFY